MKKKQIISTQVTVTILVPLADFLNLSIIQELWKDVEKEKSVEDCTHGKRAYGEVTFHVTGVKGINSEAIISAFMDTWNKKVVDKYGHMEVI